LDAANFGARLRFLPDVSVVVLVFVSQMVFPTLTMLLSLLPLGFENDLKCGDDSFALSSGFPENVAALTLGCTDVATADGFKAVRACLGTAVAQMPSGRAALDGTARAPAVLTVPTVGAPVT
jgi:hypothetical protein